MAIHIESNEADQLARELTELTGESLKNVVITALREHLEREAGRRRDKSLREEIAEIQRRIAALPRQDSRSDEEIIGCDGTGAPK